MDAITFPPAPTNEPNLTYAPGSAERKELEGELERLRRREKNLRGYVGGRWKALGGPETAVVEPHDHQHVLGRFKGATKADAKAAVKAATDAAPEWRAVGMDDPAGLPLQTAHPPARPRRPRRHAAA